MKNITTQSSYEDIFNYLTKGSNLASTHKFFDELKHEAWQQGNEPVNPYTKWRNTPYVHFCMELLQLKFAETQVKKAIAKADRFIGILNESYHVTFFENKSTDEFFIMQGSIALSETRELIQKAIGHYRQSVIEHFRDDEGKRDEHGCLQINDLPLLKERLGNLQKYSDQIEKWSKELQALKTKIENMDKRKLDYKRLTYKPINFVRDLFIQGTIDSKTSVFVTRSEKPVGDFVKLINNLRNELESYKCSYYEDFDEIQHSFCDETTTHFIHKMRKVEHKILFWMNDLKERESACKDYSLNAKPKQETVVEEESDAELVMKLYKATFPHQFIGSNK